MGKGDKPSDVIAEQLEQLLKKVREMERGGNLDELLNEEVDALGLVVREQAVRERDENDDRHEAVFPPCDDVPEVREREDEEGRQA